MAKPGGSGNNGGGRPLETDATRRVESQRFSWLSRKVLIDSRYLLFGQIQPHIGLQFTCQGANR